MSGVKNIMLMSGDSYDPAIITLMARWTALGYTHPSPAALTSLNLTIKELRTAGVLTGFDGLWIPMLNDAGLVSTSGALNIISPSANQWTFPVAPNFTASGVKGDKISKYVLMNFNPTAHGVNYTLNNGSFGYYQYVGGTTTNYTMGEATSSLVNMLNADIGAVAVRINSGNLAVGNPATANVAEYYAVDRQDATNVKVYNGTSVHTTTAAASSRPNTSLFLLRGAFGYSDAGMGMAFIGRSFSVAEHAAIRTAILAHKTRLGL